MAKSTKALAKWILGFVILELVLVAAVYLLQGGNATLDAKLPFLLILYVVNLPGVLLAGSLGLQGQDPWGATGDPRFVIPVVFGFSLIFFSGFICVIRRGLTGRGSESGHTGNDEK